MKRVAREPRTNGQTTRTRPTIWDAVYAIVRRVPRGHVVTYGQIAKLLENRISPRYVGFAMHVCPKDVPWHRVVNAAGGCSTDRLPGDQPCRQRILLEREGVRFRVNGTLSIADHQWSPRKRGMRC